MTLKYHYLDMVPVFAVFLMQLCKKEDNNNTKTDTLMCYGKSIQSWLYYK